MTIFKKAQAKGTKLSAVPQSALTSVNVTKSFITPPKALSTFTVNKGVDTATGKNGSTTITAFDSFVGINSKNPEVISFADFIPLYDDSGNLTEAGRSLQTKQDALLLSARKSINSVLELPTASDVFTQLEINRGDLQKFCKEFGEGIEKTFALISEIKKGFDFRTPISNPQVIAGEQLNPASIQEVLFDSSNAINNWTNTKVWVRSCLELKEVLKGGLPNGLLSNNGSIATVKNKALYNDRTSLLDPTKNFSTATAGSYRFGFANKQYATPSFTNSANIGPVEFDQFVSDISKVYENGPFNFIVNGGNYDEAIAEHIAKMCYVLSKEYYFSKQLKGTVFDRWYAASNFPKNVNVSGKYEFWDYLIGRSGQDITDIPVAPGGTNFSLINLAQSQETYTNQFGGTETAEVLTFENEYIVDNIGTVRSTVVLTPGSYFYLENALQSAVNTFAPPQRLYTLKDNVELYKSLFFDFRKYLTFDLASLVPRTLAEIVTDSPRGIVSEEETATSQLNTLSNPLSLFRKIVDKTVINNALLDRALVFTLTGNNQLNSSNVNNFGPLLMREATITKGLYELLFVYVAGIMNENLSATVGKKVTSTSNSGYQLGGEAGVFDTVDFPSLDESAAVNVTYQERITTKIIEKLKNKKQGFAESVENAPKVYKFDEIFNQLNDKTSNTYNFFKSIADFMKSQVDATNLATKVYSLENKNGTPDYYTFYSSISRTTFFCGLFQLMCYVMRLASIDGIGSLENDGQQIKIGQAQYKSTSVTVLGKQTSILHLEKQIPYIEELIFEESKNFTNYLDRFYVHMFLLGGKINNFFNSFPAVTQNSPSNPLGSLIQQAISVIGDRALVQLLLTDEQLKLVKSKLLYFEKRIETEYSSAIKTVQPYFLDLENDPSVEYLLPLEDTHLCAWNFFLKDFFKNDQAFRYSSAFNKKIISIAIPQGLVRRLSRAYASDYSSNAGLNPIIKINLYRKDEFRPTLIHKPLSFLFNAREYPVRLLNYHVPGTPEYLNDSISTTQILNEDQQKFQDEIKRNHELSFVLEEYLNFTTATHFDEQRYHQYELIKKDIDTAFAQYLTSLNVTGSLAANASTSKYYVEENLLSDPDMLKKNLIMPKKFDRVFHLLFDPDDFEINTDSSNGTKSVDLARYQDVIQQFNENGQTKYRRVQTTPGEIAFDSYYANIELI